MNFKVNFLCQILSDSFSILSFKNINLGARFLLLTFFDNIEIEWLLFLKWCLFFDTSPLIQFSKSNNFLWVCWFLGKNLSSFVPPVWKLHNPYCHNGDDHTPILADRLSLFQSEGKIETARLLLAQTSDFQNFLRPFLNWV